MAFPSVLTAYTQTTATSRLNNPSHSGLHNTVSSALGQVEAVLGVDGANSVLGTIIGDLRSPGSGGGGHVQTAAKGGTGQTVFAKGDTLIGQSSSVISKLTVGTDGYLYTANSAQAAGIQWSSPGSVLSANVPTPTVHVYTASSVAGWTKPSLLAYVVVEVVGGGGGGEGNNHGATNITAGGTGVFGASSLVSATGGGSGATAAGIGVNGDINIRGQAGMVGFTTGSGGGFAGVGGGSHYGGGGISGTVGGGAGGQGGLYGGGGGGGASGGSTQAGGNGGSGGGYARRKILPSLLGVSENITVASNGTGANGGGITNAGGDGNNGIVIVTDYYI